MVLSEKPCSSASVVSVVEVRASGSAAAAAPPCSADQVSKVDNNPWSGRIGAPAAGYPAAGASACCPAGFRRRLGAYRSTGSWPSEKVGLGGSSSTGTSAVDSGSTSSPASPRWRWRKPCRRPPQLTSADEGLLSPEVDLRWLNSSDVIRPPTGSPASVARKEDAVPQPELLCEVTMRIGPPPPPLRRGGAGAIRAVGLRS